MGEPHAFQASERLAFRPPTEDDLAYVAERMRKLDALECKLMSGLTPMTALQLCADQSDLIWAAVLDGEPVAIFGLSAPTEIVGHPWLLGTDRLREVPLLFVKSCAAFVHAWLTVRPVLYNVTLARNELHVKWIKSLGFETTESRVIDGHKFLGFRLCASPPQPPSGSL